MKLAKLSLAAIMAVGAISAANAGSLEDAIKGVEFSGSVSYTLSGSEQNKVDQGSTNDWDVGMTFVAPVADNLKATIGFGTDAGTDAALDDVSNREGAKDQGFDIKDLYFTYAKDALTVKGGYQYLPTAVTDESGNGVVAMYNVGAATFAGGYFANTESDGGADVMTVAAMGSVAMVNGQVWYTKVPGIVKDNIFVQVDGSVAGLSVKGQFISTKLENVSDTGTFYAIDASYKINNFGLRGVYTNNDDKQPLHALANDGTTGVIYAGDRMSQDNGGKLYETAYGVEATAGFDKFGVLVGYAVGKNLDITNDPDNSQKNKETYGKVSYAYSKNFTTYVKYSDRASDLDAQDQKFYRFNATYKF